MINNPVIGIDLGTTFSAMAYINQHGRPEIIPNREGERSTPSVVLFDGETPIVGTIAKRSAVASPLNICQFVKRHMGEKDWRYLTENEKKYSCEEISALILHRLKEDAETTLGCEVKDAVITVPAYFNDAQRKSTQDAANIAGLNVLRIVNEPTAAALAYCLEQDHKQTIMVYDLGGGTFDVTIMRIKNDEIEVIVTNGDKNLGGFDWDNKLMEFINEEFKKSGGVDLFEDLATQQDLRDKAEIAKKTLSSRDNTKVFLSASGKNVSVNISREDFDSITLDLINRTKSLMTNALEDSKITWPGIDKILLVGGSTRMKAVPEMIEKVSGKKPSAELHPDEIVAVGATLLGGILQKKTGNVSLSHLDALPNVEISDVNSHSLGVVALDSMTNKEFNSIILKKDTKIPTKKSEVYCTILDNQTRIDIQVTEGEEKNLEYVHVIGNTTVDIPPYPKGAPIEVFFQYDDNGIVNITVFDKTAGKMIGELKIKRQSNRSIDEVEEMKRKISQTEIQ